MFDLNRTCLIEQQRIFGATPSSMLPTIAQYKQQRAMLGSAYLSKRKELPSTIDIDTSDAVDA